ncbi:uncharacterized protein SPPG_09279 [Spizellomyces punctatus DAOM BR117]|uniref:TmcB/TmcC TPR repeats domain-containing protein n=1 Tax=Spizellomyces punctatus (strain DAOM BR117) TaxID=645134 RepID=A0A0L0HDK2_SPIPD|nr:uncharacterized protein SPPG_09279 [Spizellomyces punctatus DAOM BR117]KNC99207.1 hypothetical protein SPPG_09279 [Spizellomyces punctatus DAOM BR117]|eukprot:XP_016607247.1 hypothetical protein SPPG_09279 [Spizellomyces punctatus DAOM BR117]
MQGAGAGKMDPNRQSTLEKAIFQLLYAMTKGAEFSPAIGVIHQLVEDMQFLVVPWDSRTLIKYAPRWLDYVFDPFRWATHNYLYLRVVLWILFAGVMMTFLMVGVVAAQFKKGSFKWIWPLVLLRYSSTLISTVLFQPIVEIFVVTVYCRSDPATGNLIVGDMTEVACFSAEHLPMFVSACLGIILIVPFGALINYVFVECEPGSRNPGAKAHGMCDLVYLICKLVLVIVQRSSCIDNQLISLFVIHPILIYTYTRYQPYFNGYMNSVRVGIFTATLLSAIVSMVTYKTTTPEGSSSPLPIIFLILSIPTGLVIGFWLTKAVRELIVRRIMYNIKLKLEIESADTERGCLSPAATLAPSNLKRKKSMFTPGMSMSIVATAVETENKGKTCHEARESVDSSPKTPKALAAIQDYKSVTARKSLRPPVVFKSWLEADIGCRFLRESVRDAASLEIMTIVFMEAIEQYPKHPGLALNYAYYLWTFGDDPNTAQYYVEAAKANSPSFDVRFRIYMEEREHEQESRAEDLATSSFNVASYVEYQSMERQAIESHLRSLTAMKLFWSSLAREQLNVKTFPAYLDVMYNTQSSATIYYEKLLERFPNSKQILRLYAKYLLTVKNNQELGVQLLTQAEDIEYREQQEAHERAMRVRTVGSGRQSVQNLSRFKSNSIMQGELSAASSGPLPIEDGKRQGPGDQQSQRESSNAEDGLSMQVPGTKMVETVRKRTLPTIEDVPSGSDVFKSDDKELERPPQGVFVEFAETSSDINRPPSPELPVQSTMSVGSKIANENPPVLKVSLHRAKSQTSSNNSNRDSRRQKAIRTRMRENMISSVRKCTLYGRVWFLLLLGLLIGNYHESSGMFNAPTTFLSTLRENTKARRSCTTAALAIRGLWVAGKLGDHAKWNESTHKLVAEVQRAHTLIIPTFYQTAAFEVENAVIVRYSKSEWGSPGTVMHLNPYELILLTTSSAEAILRHKWEDFLDYARMEQDVEIRMWFDNTLKMCDSFDWFATKALNDYLDGSTNRSQIVVALLIIVIVVLLLAAGIFYVTLRQAAAKHKVVIDVLKNIPKSSRHKIVDNLEEEIEELLELEDTQDRKQVGITRDIETSVSKWLIVKYTWSYIAAVSVLACLAVSLFIPPMLSGSHTDNTAFMILASNSRRYESQTINYLAHELAAADSHTWAPYQVQLLTEIRIDMLERLHHDVLNGAGKTPSLNTIPEVDGLTRIGGMCLRDSGCQDIAYNATIGFTQDFIYSGANNILTTLFDRARHFVATGDYSRDNPDLLLMENIEVDIADGLKAVDELLLTVAKAVSNHYMQVVNILFSVTIVYYVLFYTYFFWMIIRAVQAQIRQMVAVIFWVPSDILSECPQMQSFINLGGIAQAAEMDKKTR